MNKTPLRIGVVGAGKMGGFHLSKLKESKDAMVAGVYDVHEDKALDAAAKFETTPFHDLASLLAACDAVIVAASTAFHFPITLKALEAGLHVLVEKPASGHFPLASQLFQKAAEKKLVLKIGFLERLRLEKIPARLFPEKISVIRAQRMSTSAARDQSVDILADLMIHDLDIVAHLISDEPLQIEARQWAEPPISSAKFDFGDNGVAELQCTYSAKNLSRAMVIEGDDRRLFVDFQKGRYVEMNSRTEGELPSDALALQLEQFIAQIRAHEIQGQEKQLRSLSWSESLRVALAPVSLHERELPALIPTEIFEPGGIPS